MRDRLLWHRPSLASACAGARILAAAHREPRYVYATHLGYVIARRPPDSPCTRVEANGTTVDIEGAWDFPVAFPFAP